MARRFPKNLSPPAQEKIRQLSGFREFNIPSAEAGWRAKVIIKESKDAERALAKYRNEQKNCPKNPLRTQRLIDAGFRKLKDQRREAFEKMIEIKGESGNPLLVGKDELQRGTNLFNEFDDYNKLWGHKVLQDAHWKKLDAMRKQKKPKLPA